MTFTLLTLSLAANIGLLAQSTLKTTAESSGYTSTSTHADVMAFVKELASATNLVRVETLATSIEGKDIPLLLIADPMPADPKDLESDDRIVVYLQANIHAGEVEGKEASLMLARDLVRDPRPEILDNIVLLICPILNADGNDRISPENRTNQVGPVNGVGVRHNGQFLDMNRDAIKLETPELKGVVTQVFNRYDPAVTVDCHTTNGSYHEEPVTFTWMMNPNGDRNLIHYMRDRMMPEVHEMLLANRNVENIFYGEFIDRLNPDSGWISYASEPRYLVNYIGVRNRLAILNENYVYADFQTRVNGCYQLLWSILEYAAEHRDEIKTLLAESDLRLINRFAGAQATDSFAIEYRGVPTPDPITIKAIEADTIPGVRGYWRYKQSDRKRTVTVPYIADYIPVKNIAVPYAYLIVVPDPEVLENISSHGIAMEILTEDTRLNVEGFRMNELNGASRLYQGHYCNTIKGELTVENRNFPAGTRIVFTSQPLGNLASYLLEPQSDDGLLPWNFFDRYLVPQWGGGFFPYPVYRLMEKADLKTEVIEYKHF
ncbi:MAG: hypothetical protein JXA03_04250 [Bacteroidales bacterium]|nr:hypothetical protein [Bacteroidales bacterium]